MIAAALGLLREPRVTAALTTTAIGLVTLAFVAQTLIGWPGYLAALVGLDVLLLASLVARRREIEWHAALLPISLLAYLAWISLSLLWAVSVRTTALGVGYLLLVTVVGVFIALSRDSIQIIRSVGDVLRATLLAGVVLEVLVGILLDTEFAALGIRGLLGSGGPISGLAGTRNDLGLLAVVGAITFAIEWRTRSITRRVAIPSLALAAFALVTTRSPVITMIAVVVGLAALTLFGIRRLPAERRQFAQYGLLVALAVVAVLAWLFRQPIIALFNAGGDLNFRLRVWDDALSFVPAKGLEGWGWIGTWNDRVAPYSVLSPTAGRPHDSALNAIVDLALQIGLVGVALFLVVVGLAFTRSWLLAGRRRSVVHAWPALVLVALIAISVVESSILTDLGWLLFVVCAVGASAQLSWRRALSPRPDPGDAEPAA